MKLFGTDGVRGLVNEGALTPDIIMRLAQGAASVFLDGDHRHTVIIGKDTRLSGYMIEPALTAGFISMGMNVVMLGPIPTPAISMLVRSMRADLGVMISASHNPYYDNGIKFFGPDGYKLCDQKEQKIASLVQDATPLNLCSATTLGRATRLESSSGRYIEFVKNTVARRTRFDGLKIVVDCANGAAYHVAPLIFWELGAKVVPLAADPDGTNINDKCGAVHPERLQETVLKEKADLGIALDGDADRLVVVDEKGKVVDGDQVMALIAGSLHRRSSLRGNAVVATVMSNMGLEGYLAQKQLELIRTPVGDRHVCEAMRARDCNVGGEQSGHIILSDYARTGDGLVAAMQMVSQRVKEQKPASEVFHCFDPVPQKLCSLRLKGGEDPMKSTDFQKLINTVEQEIGEKGRLLIRKSGTEPLIRLMVESTDRSLLTKALDQLTSHLKAQGFVA